MGCQVNSSRFDTLLSNCYQCPITGKSFSKVSDIRNLEELALGYPSECPGLSVAHRALVTPCHLSVSDPSLCDTVLLVVSHCY